MAEETNIVRHKHVLEGEREVESGLERIAKAAEKVREIGRSALMGFASIGGLIGAFEIGETVREVANLYDAVGRVKSITGDTATNTSVLLSTFQRFGISIDSAESSITRMTMKGQQLEDAMMGVAGGGKQMRYEFLRMGVDISKGPTAALISMAKAAQEGRLHAQDLRMLFHQGPEQAGAMMEMLRQGPQKLRETMDEIRKAGGVVDAQTLSSWRQMKLARDEFKHAWENLVSIFVKQILPAITPILTALSQNLEKLAPAAESFASALGAGLTVAVAHMKTIVALLAISKALSMSTGSGILGNAGRAAGGVGGLLSKLFGGGAAAGAPIIESSTGAVIGSEAVAAGGGFAALAIPLAIAAAGLAALAAAAGAMWVAWKANTDGISDAIRDLWDQFKASVLAVWDVVKDLVTMVKVSGVFDLIKEALVVIGNTLLEQLKTGMQVANFLMQQLVAVGLFVKSMLHDPFQSFALAYLQANKDAATMIAQERIRMNQRDQYGPNVPDERSGPGDMVFINPVFNIDQKFAEGFDPDRIALAFESDLQNLAERQHQSGYATLYGAK